MMLIWASIVINNEGSKKAVLFNIKNKNILIKLLIIAFGVMGLVVLVIDPFWLQPKTMTSFLEFIDNA